MKIARSTDYATIRALLENPKCYRRMTGNAPRSVEVGPREGLEYVLIEEENPIAVFVIVQGVEVHFCFAPEVWGRTLEIAKAFIDWAWKNLEADALVGPVPKRNRLALKLAERSGFIQSHEDGELVYAYLERPAA